MGDAGRQEGKGPRRQLPKELGCCEKGSVRAGEDAWVGGAAGQHPHLLDPVSSLQSRRTSSSELPQGQQQPGWCSRGEKIGRRPQEHSWCEESKILNKLRACWTEQRREGLCMWYSSLFTLKTETCQTNCRPLPPPSFTQRPTMQTSGS